MNLHDLAWATRRKTADLLRGLANKIHEDLEYRVLGWEAHIVPGEGMVFTESNSDGLTLLYSEKYRGGHEDIHAPIPPDYTGKVWIWSHRVNVEGDLKWSYHE